MARYWEKILPQPIQLKHIRLCPTLDLVAVVTNEKTLEVFRFDGQRAFMWKQAATSASIVSLCWQPDGVLRSDFVAPGPR